MKSCPVCGKDFPDEYSFCLTDGATLGTHSEEPTVIVQRSSVKQPRRNSILIFVLAALLSLSLGAMAAVLYFFWPRQSAGNDQIVVSASPSPVASTTPSPKPTRTPLPEPSPTPSKDEGGTPPQPPSPLQPDAGTTRITFRPGRTQESVSGIVREYRSFVLVARPNQRLRALVDSPGDCVNFDSGDLETAYSTVAGNNYLKLLNSCDDPSTFTLTVSIK